jgi:hypothetical protein
MPGPITPLTQFPKNPPGTGDNTGIVTPAFGTTISPMAPVNTDLSSFAGNPNISPLQTAIQQFTANYKPVDFSNPTYQAQDTSKMELPQYDAMRSRINQQYAQSQGQAQDALDRQFAAMGGGPGNGAQAKQTENLQANVAKQEGQDLASINAQEAAMRSQLQQIQQAEQFQSGEAAANRGFQGQEFNAQQGLGVQQAGLQGAAELANLNTGYQEAEAQTQQNAAAQQFNSELAAYQAKHGGGISHFCGEANKVHAFSDLDKRAVSMLLHYSLKRDRELTRLYILDGWKIAAMANKKIEGWPAKNTVFIRNIIKTIENGNIEAAYESYREYFFTLVNETCPGLQRTVEVING